jgi:hypothetical protein
MSDAASLANQRAGCAWITPHSEATSGYPTTLRRQAWSLQGRKVPTESEYIDEERYRADQLEGWKLVGCPGEINRARLHANAWRFSNQF